MMFKVLTNENLDSEHICCSISGKDEGVHLKKTWLKEQMKHGVVFRKLDVRGKVFIEYLPAEYAFAPIEAKDFLYINCFWVSGKFKKQGYGKALLESCINDAKQQHKAGVVVLSSKKKMPFLSDGKYLKKHGFVVCDTKWHYELLYFPIQEGIKPKFIKAPLLEGNHLYYSHQCPHTEKYVNILKNTADVNGFPLTIHFIDTVENAKSCPCPFTTYSLVIDGEFYTNEILTEKKFLEIIKEH